MQRWVEISFDCLPLRSVTRLDIPLDASPAFQQRCLRIKDALTRHGAHNSYFLYNAHCVFHLLNDETRGILRFAFDGTLLTDSNDVRAVSTDLDVKLESETCSWLSEPIVDWFAETVRQAVKLEFDRYVRAGDLEKTKARIEHIQSCSDDAAGYLGMYL